MRGGPGFWVGVVIFVLVIILALIPWGWLVLNTTRWVGYALLGPHMYFVGYKIDQARKRARDAGIEYLGASATERKAILDEYHEELMVKARVQVKKAIDGHARRTKREQARVEYLRQHKYIFLNSNTHGNANIKYVASADPTRSGARPAPGEPSTASRPQHRGLADLV